MKKFVLFSFVLLSVCLVNASTKFYDATQFPLLGKGVGHTSKPYNRLPDSLENITRKPVWNLSLNSAGMAVRFASNSTEIKASWKSTQGNKMNHMTEAGTRGLDLYVLGDDGRWAFAGSGRPKVDSLKNTVSIIANMAPKEREYMLYLSLYDGVDSLYIGIDSAATISQPKVNLPKREKPIVFYGTSILQGGCASRPGMAHTNILERWLNRETINFGFSGNGQLDLEVAEVIKNIDAGMFILDFVPNASVQQMNEKMVRFYKIIRDAHPTTPMIFLEDPRFPSAKFDDKMRSEVAKKNATVGRIFNEMKAAGDKNIYFLRSDKMIGTDNEATVDGIHFTDLGFMRYCDFILPTIKKHLK